MEIKECGPGQEIILLDAGDRKKANRYNCITCGETYETNTTRAYCGDCLFEMIMDWKEQTKEILDESMKVLDKH